MRPEFPAPKIRAFVAGEEEDRKYAGKQWWEERNSDNCHLASSLYTHHTYIRHPLHRPGYVPVSDLSSSRNQPHTVWARSTHPFENTEYRKTSYSKRENSYPVRNRTTPPTESETLYFSLVPSFACFAFSFACFESSFSWSSCSAVTTSPSTSFSNYIKQS
jgi:hypothetical protein